MRKLFKKSQPITLQSAFHLDQTQDFVDREVMKDGITIPNESQNFQIEQQIQMEAQEERSFDDPHRKQRYTNTSQNQMLISNTTINSDETIEEISGMTESEQLDIVTTLARQPFPELNELRDLFYNSHFFNKKSQKNYSLCLLNLRQAKALNIPELVKDGLINLNQKRQTSITLEYLPFQRSCSSGIFIGQHIDGEPHGFIRYISKQGLIYEGMAYADQFRYGSSITAGWGREIQDDQIIFGCQSNGKLLGACEVVKYDYFSNASYKKVMGEDPDKYPEWNFKKNYIIDFIES